MIINILQDGTIEMLYNEELNYEELGGDISIVRASNVEPTADGRWVVDFAEEGLNEEIPLSERTHQKRSAAISFEVRILEARMQKTPGQVVKYINGGY